MMDGGRLGPAVRAFRHATPPSAPPGDLVAPGAQRRARSGAAPEPHARCWRRGLSGGEEEGRPGRRRGRRWGGGRGGGSAAIGTPPPSPLPAALAPRGRSGRLPPSQALCRGAFPLPAPGWAERWAGGGQQRLATESPSEQGCGCTRTRRQLVSPESRTCPLALR